MFETIKFIKIFLISFVLLVLLDIFWISYLMKDFYKFYILKATGMPSSQLNFSFLIGLLVWFLIVFGAMIFVRPLIFDASQIKTFIIGATYGLVIYGVYDLTNLATITNWSIYLVMIDIFWGAYINGVLALIISFLDHKFI